MKKTIILLSILSLIIFSFTLVYGEPQGLVKGKRIFWSEERSPGFSERTSKLTSDQIKKIQELNRKFIEETAQLRGNLLTKRLELKSLWKNPNSDPETIKNKEKELREIQNQLRNKEIEKRLEVRKILTPEQISEFGFGWRMGPKFGHRFFMDTEKSMRYGHLRRCW